MKFLYNYDLFLEHRLSDIVNIKGSGLTYDNKIYFSEKLIRYKTLSNRINNKKIRINIKWNHSEEHNIIDRVINRTSIHNIEEFNSLIGNIIDELFLYNSQEIIEKGTYSLWVIEYDFSFIVNIDNYNIKIITLKPGMATYNVKNIIKLKSVI